MRLIIIAHPFIPITLNLFLCVSGAAVQNPALSSTGSFEPMIAGKSLGGWGLFARQRDPCAGQPLCPGGSTLPIHTCIVTNLFKQGLVAVADFVVVLVVALYPQSVLQAGSVALWTSMESH